MNAMHPVHRIASFVAETSPSWQERAGDNTDDNKNGVETMKKP